MEKVGENLLLFCRNLPANGAQIFWDTLYGDERLPLKQAFSFDACDRTHTRWHTRRFMYECVLSHAQNDP